MSTYIDIDTLPIIGISTQPSLTVLPLEQTIGGSVSLFGRVDMMPNIGVHITPIIETVTNTASTVIETVSNIPTTISATVQNLVASDSNALTTLPTLTTPAPEAAGALIMPANQLLIGTAETTGHFFEGAQEGAQNAFNSATSDASSMFGSAGSYLNSSLYYTAATAGALGLMWVGWKLHERFATRVVQNNYNNQTVTCNCPPPQVYFVNAENGKPIEVQSLHGQSMFEKPESIEPSTEELDELKTTASAA